jgi:hypothetical protein
VRRPDFSGWRGTRVRCACLCTSADRGRGEVYVLIFLLQAASAAFTPVFQATVPEVLPEERDYTQALSLSRLTYDVESLFSPAPAAALLSVITYNWLFAGTTVGFLASGALVVPVLLPKTAPVERTGGVHKKAAFGIRLFRATPRLRALLATYLPHAVGPRHRLVFDGRFDLRLTDEHDGRGLHVEPYPRRLDLRHQHRMTRHGGKLVHQLLTARGRHASRDRTEHLTATIAPRAVQRVLHRSEDVAEVGEHHHLRPIPGGVLDDLAQPVQLGRLLGARVRRSAHRHEVAGAHGLAVGVFVRRAQPLPILVFRPTPRSPSARSGLCPQCAEPAARA